VHLLESNLYTAEDIEKGVLWEFYGEAYPTQTSVEGDDYVNQFEELWESGEIYEYLSGPLYNRICSAIGHKIKNSPNIAYSSLPYRQKLAQVQMMATTLLDQIMHEGKLKRISEYNVTCDESNNPDPSRIQVTIDVKEYAQSQINRWNMSMKL